MTTLTARPVVAGSGTRRTRVARLVLRVLLAAPFLGGGLLKLTAAPEMVALFDDIGAGQGLRLLVGVCEVAGAVGLLVPRLARSAAGGLVLLMVGATVTNIVVLQTSPALPLAFGILAAVVAAAGTRKVAR